MTDTTGLIGPVKCVACEAERKDVEFHIPLPLPATAAMADKDALDCCMTSSLSGAVVCGIRVNTALWRAGLRKGVPGHGKSAALARRQRRRAGYRWETSWR